MRPLSDSSRLLLDFRRDDIVGVLHRLAAPVAHGRGLSVAGYRRLVRRFLHQRQCCTIINNIFLTSLYGLAVQKGHNMLKGVNFIKGDLHQFDGSKTRRRNNTTNERASHAAAFAGGGTHRSLDCNCLRCSTKVDKSELVSWTTVYTIFLGTNLLSGNNNLPAG